jgi:hypothetical protein
LGTTNSHPQELGKQAGANLNIGTSRRKNAMDSMDLPHQMQIGAMNTQEKPSTNVKTKTPAELQSRPSLLLSKA